MLETDDICPPDEIVQQLHGVCPHCGAKLRVPASKDVVVDVKPFLPATRLLYSPSLTREALKITWRQHRNRNKAPFFNN